MSDVEGSNALVSVVRFYSEALATEVQRRTQSEALLKTVLEKAEASRNIEKKISLSDADPERDELVDAAILWHRVIELTGPPSFELSRFMKAVDAYNRSRDPLGRVEPDRAREGEVRGSPTDGPTDVPG